jgi:spermidine synthase
MALIAAILLAACAQMTAPPAAPPESWRDIYVGPGMFGDIIVKEETVVLRRLEFGREGKGYHSIARVGDPGYLDFEYARIMTMAPAVLGRVPERVLVVGLGGGTLPTFFQAAWPQARIDAVDIDPGVVKVAEQYFGLKQDERLRVHVADGRAFIERAAPGSYDLIVLDAYEGAGAPPRHLITLEFQRAVRAALKPDGLVAANIWGPTPNPYYFDMVATLGAAFEDMSAVFALNNVNVVFFAQPRVPGVARAPLTRDVLAARAKALFKPPMYRYDLEAHARQGWLDPSFWLGRGNVLRDKAPAVSVKPPAP